MPELTVLACDSCGATADVYRYTIARDRDAVEVLLDGACTRTLTFAEASRLGRETLLAPPAKGRRGGGLSEAELLSLHRP